MAQTGELAKRLYNTIKALADEELTIATLTAVVGAMLADQDTPIKKEDAEKMVASRTIIEKHVAILEQVDKDSTLEMLGQIYMQLAHIIVMESTAEPAQTFGFPHGDRMIIVTTPTKGMQMMKAMPGLERIEMVGFNEKSIASIPDGATRH